MALSVLDEAADESACLDSMIAKKCYDLLIDFPSLAAVKSPEKGNNLLMRFLSRSTGFKYVRLPVCVCGWVCVRARHSSDHSCPLAPLCCSCNPSRAISRPSWPHGDRRSTLIGCS